MAAKYFAVCLLLTLTLQCALSEEGPPLPFMKRVMASPRTDKCLKEVSLDSIDDLFSEKGKSKITCFSLCFAKAEGYVDGDGKVVVEKFDSDEVKSRMSKEAHDKVFDCLKKLDSLKECSDVIKIRDCFKLSKL